MSLSDRGEGYLMLIDDSMKASFDGQLHLCVNQEHDCWQAADSLPIETLKKLAVTCVASRMDVRPSEDPTLTHEMRAMFRLYGV